MSRNLKIIFSILFVVIIATACNLPGNANPTPILFPTPNYTMTALFSVAETLPPVVTKTGPVVITETPVAVQPTNTSVPPTATTVIQPSATNIPPTVTNTPSIRGGTILKAAYVSTAPKLDGVWDEWTAKAYPAKFIVYGKDQFTGKDDLEGSFKVAWDKSYLYIAVKVYDDKYVENAAGADLYKGDSIEILLDKDLYGDLNSASLTSDDYQLGISLGKPSIEEGTKEAYLWYPQTSAGSKSDVKIASIRSEGITRAEIAIPWSVFGITAAEGQQYGFVVSMSDNDNSSANEQQTMASSINTRVLTNPTSWGMMQLVK